ncbi:glycoside hydrolase family 26 protein [Frondihabitans cladoniiphilus]|uniref:GH26 domain-containing protein n=1 Tax=Frondihabitans cladoniiphilus TaxID=715785 RepID=A0ABP8VXT4_9MICO
MRTLFRCALAALVAAAVFSTAACTSSEPPVQITPKTSAPAEPAPTGKWLSGASGNGVTGGQFAEWRGRPVDIAGTWSDDDTNSLHFWQLQKGGDYASWDKPLDIAVGAIDKGESWADAAEGDYDARWTQSLTTLKSLRSGTTATTYIRFAHEMNGNWYPWQVNAGNYRDFMTAWKRYRAIQQAVFPESKLVFSVNRESVGTGMDWTKYFPGKEYVDVLSVDYYNGPPGVFTANDWNRSLQGVDQWGGPKGLAQHAAFAQREGLPLAISEWSGDSSAGDSPAFVTGLLDYVKAHSGTAPGQILYEILFDVPQNDGRFVLYSTGTVKMPKSSAAYKKFFD